MKNRSDVSSLGIIFLTMILLVGCGGGGDDEAQASSAIQGNVEAFGTAVVEGKLLVGALPQISVSLEGTDYTAEVNSDGSFRIGNVEPGDYVLVFTSGGVQGRYPISVPPNTTVVLVNVTITSVGSVTVQTAESAAVEDSGQNADWVLGSWTGTITVPTMHDAIKSSYVVMTFNPGGYLTGYAAQAGMVKTGTYSVTGANTVHGTLYIEPGVVCTVDGVASGNTMQVTLVQNDSIQGFVDTGSGTLTKQ